MKAEPPGIDKPPPQCVFRDSVCCHVCVWRGVGGEFGGGLDVFIPDLYMCKNWRISICCGLCVCWYSECSVRGDPWSGSPVTGAHLRSCKRSSQCTKQPPEDRISHCDLAPEVTAIHLRGQTWNTHCHVLQTHKLVEVEIGSDHEDDEGFKMNSLPEKKVLTNVSWLINTEILVYHSSSAV